MATFTATDPEGADIDWFVEGTDDSKFEITDGVLSFKSPPDFEDPGDVERAAILDDPDTDDVDEMRPLEPGYEQRLRVDDQSLGGTGSRRRGCNDATTQDITVTVTNVEEPGTIDLTHVQPQTGVELTASLTDPDGDDGGDEAIERPTSTWQWSVPKVSRPVMDNDDHWTPGAATSSNAAYDLHRVTRPRSCA